MQNEFSQQARETEYIPNSMYPKIDDNDSSTVNTETTNARNSSRGRVTVQNIPVEHKRSSCFSHNFEKLHSDASLDSRDERRLTDVSRRSGDFSPSLRNSRGRNTTNSIASSSFSHGIVQHRSSSTRSTSDEKYYLQSSSSDKTILNEEKDADTTTSKAFLKAALPDNDLPKAIGDSKFLLTLLFLTLTPLFLAVLLRNRTPGEESWVINFFRFFDFFHRI